MSTYRGVEATCPFYIQDSAKTIHCEGILPGERSIRRKFEEAEDCTRIYRKCCAGKYTACPIYELINRVKYANG